MPLRDEVVVTLLLRTFDLAGTFAFAISGALAGFGGSWTFSGCWCLRLRRRHSGGFCGTC